MGDTWKEKRNDLITIIPQNIQTIIRITRRGHEPWIKKVRSYFKYRLAAPKVPIVNKDGCSK